jgi:hypothetical protein
MRLTTGDAQLQADPVPNIAVARHLLESLRLVETVAERPFAQHRLAGFDGRTYELEVTRNAYRYHDQVDRGMRDQVGRIIERKRNRKLSFRFLRGRFPRR